MKALLTADLHLTARPADEYRWEVLDWLRRQAQRKQVDAVIIAGDLTDAKDNHSAVLVNRLVAGLRQIAKVAPVYAISGNHDYIDPKLPFFSFLQGMRDVRYMTTPQRLTIAGAQFAFLPHTDRPGTHWRDLPWRDLDFAIFHQPIKGATGENGTKLKDGMPLSKLSKCRSDCQVIGGDVHVPQRIGCATYTGAPYPVRFGDEYKPRVLYWDGGQMTSIARTVVRKAILKVEDVREIAKAELAEGDMLRVEYSLRRADYPDWPAIRKTIISYCRRRKLVLCGLEARSADAAERMVKDGPRLAAQASSAVVYKGYCRAREVVKPLFKLGRSILESVNAASSR